MVFWSLLGSAAAAGAAGMLFVGSGLAKKAIQYAAYRAALYAVTQLIEKTVNVDDKLRKTIQERTAASLNEIIAKHLLRISMGYMQGGAVGAIVAFEKCLKEEGCKAMLGMAGTTVAGETGQQLVQLGSIAYQVYDVLDNEERKIVADYVRTMQQTSTTVFPLVGTAGYAASGYKANLTGW